MRILMTFFTIMLCAVPSVCASNNTVRTLSAAQNSADTLFNKLGSASSAGGPFKGVGAVSKALSVGAKSISSSETDEEAAARLERERLATQKEREEERKRREEVYMGVNKMAQDALKENGVVLDSGSGDPEGSEGPTHPFYNFHTSADGSSFYGDM